MKNIKDIIPTEAKKAMKGFIQQEAEMNAAVHAGADTPARFTLTLGDEEIDFEFGARAHFRMGTAERPFDLTECTNAKRAQAATVTWLWACLAKHEVDQYPDPEDLAEMIPLDRLLDCTKAFIKAIADYNAGRKLVQKTEAAKAVTAKP